MLSSVIETSSQQPGPARQMRLSLNLNLAIYKKPHYTFLYNAAQYGVKMGLTY